MKFHNTDKQELYLGDGAYAVLFNDSGEHTVTANHHEPEKATDVVVIENHGLEVLYKALQSVFEPPKIVEHDWRADATTVTELAAMTGCPWHKKG